MIARMSESDSAGIASLLYKPVSDDISQLPFKIFLGPVDFYGSEIQDINLIGNGNGGANVLVDE